VRKGRVLVECRLPAQRAAGPARVEVVDHRLRAFCADRRRRRLAALRPLHGAGAVHPRAWATTRATPPVRPLPASGSDFVTAPELSPLFGQALAVQVAQALDATGTHEVWEFGAGSGALAAQLLGALGAAVRALHIVDLSGACASAAGRTAASPGPDRVHWHDACPTSMHGVVVGNEVLDAMPVQLLASTAGLVRTWRGRATTAASPGPTGRPRCARRPSAPPFLPGAVTEIHPQAEAFVRTLAERLQRGAAFFIDYGFPEHEYYHPQRHGGTLMCHRAHQADTDPLADPGCEGHHRARQLQRRGAGRRRTPGCRCWATPRRRASC
jgi:hypothetical protein